MGNGDLEVNTSGRLRLPSWLVGLLVTQFMSIIVLIGGFIWWASGISKDLYYLNNSSTESIRNLSEDMKTQRLLIDATRERTTRVEIRVDALTNNRKER